VILQVPFVESGALTELVPYAQDQRLNLDNLRERRLNSGKLGLMASIVCLQILLMGSICAFEKHAG
jgi:hypothetical protein